MAKKPAFLFNQAGALPYRLDGQSVEIILITSRSSASWIFPKGVIEPGETPESTAVKEAFEEAGIVGDVTGATLGRYEQEKWGGVAKIGVYPLLVRDMKESWNEQGSRQRQVVSLDEALKMVPPDLPPVLNSFQARLAGNEPPRG